MMNRYPSQFTLYDIIYMLVNTQPIHILIHLTTKYLNSREITDTHFVNVIPSG